MRRGFAILALAAFILLPLTQAVILSFTVTLPVEGRAVGSFSLMNYTHALTTPELQSAILNSLAYVTMNVALCLICGLPAAYALARFRFVGDRHFLLLILVFRVTPPVVLSLPIFIIFAISAP